VAVSDATQQDEQADLVPQTLVGISFPDVFRAQEFLTAVTRLKANGSLVLEDAVVVVKDDDGKTVVRETIDPQPGPSPSGTTTGPAAWCGSSRPRAR
jgi:uncharacterized membrane protein